MIAIIADDLSGAAEMGGAAWRMGLSAEIFLKRPASSTADVVIVDTDSRSCQPDAAAQRVAAAWSHLAKMEPEWVYEKIDSVFRGRVLAETRTLMKEGGFRRAVMIPANPRRGRTVCDGHCYIDAQPLHETCFAQDPEYPPRTHRVLDLLGKDSHLDCHVSVDLEMPWPEGILIPDVQSADALRRCAARLDEDVLAVGAVEFFETLLELRASGSRPAAESPEEVPSTGSTLLVCGSPTAWREMRKEQCLTRRVSVAIVPCDTPGHRLDRLEHQLAAALHAEHFAAIAFDDARPGDPHQLLAPCIALAMRLLTQPGVSRCLVEGGATASSLLRTLQLESVRIHREYQPGVVGVRGAQMETEFIIKPGSYDWPDWVWPQQESH